MIAIESRLFRVSLFASLFLALGLSLASCGAGGAQSRETGPQTATSKSISVDLKFPDGYSYNRSTGELSGAGPEASRIAPYVTRITLTISGNGITPITVDVPIDTMSVTVFLSRGTYTFTITVYTSIGLTFTGSATGEIGVVKPPAISFDLDVNSPPTLDSLSVGSSSITTSQQTTLNASASDQDPDDILTYQWSASGGSVAGSGNTATFSSGTPGTYTVNVLVSDGHGGTATGSAQVSVLNRPPTISFLTVSDSSVNISQQATLSVTASDPDPGDTLTYQWSSSGGSVIGSGSVATFSSGTPGTYTITVLVSDRYGGSATGSAQVSVLNQAPTILTLTLDAEETYYAPNLIQRQAAVGFDPSVNIQIIINRAWHRVGVFDPAVSWYNQGEVYNGCDPFIGAGNYLPFHETFTYNTIQLSCVATDPDGDPLAYSLTATLLDASFTGAWPNLFVASVSQTIIDPADASIVSAVNSFTGPVHVWDVSTFVDLQNGWGWNTYTHVYLMDVTCAVSDGRGGTATHTNRYAVKTFACA